MSERRCAILVPVSDHIEPECERTLGELARRGYAVRRMTGHSAIDLARSMMASDALAEGFDELVWIDADIAFSMESFERLRANDVPLVCGIYPKKGQRELVAFHLDRGRRYFERESDGDALVELRRAVYLSPYQAEAHLLIGRIHLRAGRLPEAINAFKIALWSEESAAGHAALGEAFRQARDFDGARREAERALEMSPGLTDATALLERLKTPPRSP